MDICKLGKLIAARRHALGYTQEELGNLLGVSDKAVSKWERGLCCPDITSISRLAAELKISVMSLMTGEASPVSESSLALQKYDLPESADALLSAPLLPAAENASRNIVSPYLFGTNLEHTRADIWRGVSAQMLKNRKFAGKPSMTCGTAAKWLPVGNRGSYALSEPYTRHYETGYHMHRRLECSSQRAVNFHAGESVGIRQQEVVLRANTDYSFAVICKTETPVTLHAELTDRYGKTLYAAESFTVVPGDWAEHTAVLTPDKTDDDAALQLRFDEEGYVDIGAVSLMPADNFRGMRKDVISALREMGIKVLRWPGGNFAGEYCWFDGLLPRDMRAPFESFLGIETQPHSMGYDYHEINTDDFVALCREVGAEPFITLNLAWNTPEEHAAWVEYCNGDTSTPYGKLRAERGHEAPYNVQLWSLGNEFGYGHMEGDNSPYGYSSTAIRAIDAMRAAGGDLTFCSSGPYPNRDWAEHAAIPLQRKAALVSLHYYAPERVYTTKDALKQDYLTCISSVMTARTKAAQLRGMLPDDLRISYDEWNVWYAWYRPSCVTDGIFTALMLHMLIGEAEKLGISVACHFEAVNEGAINVTPDSAVLTATGQAFAMMKHHIWGSILGCSPVSLVTEQNGVRTYTYVNVAWDEEKNVPLPDGELLRAELYDGTDILPHSRFRINSAKTADGHILIPPHSMLLLQSKTE